MFLLGERILEFWILEFYAKNMLELLKNPPSGSNIERDDKRFSRQLDLVSVYKKEALIKNLLFLEWIKGHICQFVSPNPQIYVFTSLTCTEGERMIK